MSLPESSTIPSSKRRITLATLGLLAISFMLFQIALLRELRFQLMTLFTLTPFLFSTVILCIALGSSCATRIRFPSRRLLRWIVLILPLLVLPLFASGMGVAQGIIDRSSDGRFQYAGVVNPTAGDDYLHTTIIAFIAVAVFGYGLVFFLQGLIFALYFRDAREEGILSDTYGADLIASGLGAILGGVLTFFLTPVQMVIVSTVLFGVNVWVSSRYLEIRIPFATVSTLASLALIIGGELIGGFFSSVEQPAWLHVVTYSQWSRYRRIDARETPQGLEIFTDGVVFQGYRKNDRLHQGDPRTLVTKVIAESEKAVRDVLIVGAGTGADVRLLRNLIGPELNITAVELDGGFVQTARQFPWLWDYYKTARIVVQEGRFFLENSKEDYDVVIYAYIDPQSAIGSIGVPDANFLYTDSGLRAAYARVREGGHLLITRVFVEQEQEAFFQRMCSTLESAGIGPDRAAVYRRSGSTPWGYYGRLSTLHVIAKKGGEPRLQKDGSLIPLPWSSGRRPTTDLFPFSLGTGVWFDTLLSYGKRNTLPIVLVGVLLAAVAVAMATSVGRSTFFVLGFGSFLLESLIIFNSFLLFGDPNLSAALAVGVFLLWSGLGSLVSARWEGKRWMYYAVPAVVVVYALTAPILNAGMIASSVPLKLAVFTVHLSLVGIAAGMMFPIALRRFREKSVAGMFTMDVVGCALAPPVFWIAISLAGLWLVMLGAAACYLVVSVVLTFRR
jgi:spermidine synthase